MILLKFILLHYAFLVVLSKYSYRKRIAKVSNWLGGKKFLKWFGKFLYDLSECVFCCNHWGGALLVPFLYLFLGFQLEFLLFPLMSTGAIFLLDKQVD